MTHTRTNDTYLIRIDRGEAVIASLTAFCIEKHIKNAHFIGIGAVEWREMGYYALTEKKYYFTQYDELVEVVSLTGNITLKDGTPFVHMHGVFTDTTNNATGGHIKEMRVGVVLEVFLTSLSTCIERKMDECIGLALMDLH